MTLHLAVSLFSAVVALSFAFIGGFRLGGHRKVPDEAIRVHLRADLAHRQMHDLTRAAFVAMAEHAEAQAYANHNSGER
jgi:hypothetical protein